MRISRDEQMTTHAMVTALRSTCGRKMVGAIIAKEGRVISSGYAGPPAAFPHCTEACVVASSANGGCTRTVHAEQNAIAYAARHGISTEGATLYTTCSPCPNCAKLIINSGIIRVVYLEQYRDTSGIDLLRTVGIQCEIQTVPYAHFTNLRQTFASGLIFDSPMSSLSENPPPPKTSDPGNTSPEASGVLFAKTWRKSV